MRKIFTPGLFTPGLIFNRLGCVYMNSFNLGRVQPRLKVRKVGKIGVCLQEESCPGSNTGMPTREISTLVKHNASLCHVL